MIVGLDSAANRWHAVCDSGLACHVGPLIARKSTPWEDPDARRSCLCAGFMLFLANAFAEGGDVHVYCEEPLALQNGKTTRLLCMAAGALWCTWEQWATGRGLHGAYELKGLGGWTWVDTARWKKAVVGKGNATKDEIRAHALESGAPDYGVEDYFDAWCILRYGIEHRASLTDSGA